MVVPSNTLVIPDLRISVVELLARNVSVISLDPLVGYKRFIEDFRPFLFSITYIALYVRLAIYDPKR
jgi:hypothetical protein